MGIQASGISNPAVYVDVIRVKSYVDSFIDSTCVPVGISINKLDLVPDRIVSGLVGVFRNCGDLEVVFLDLLLHRSPVSPM